MRCACSRGIFRHIHQDIGGPIARIGIEHEVEFEVVLVASCDPATRPIRPRPSYRTRNQHHLKRNRKFVDSPLEQTGFEPLVPPRERTGSSPLIEMVSLPARPTQKRLWDY